MLMRYAILGLLDGREMHGYAIKAAFEARLGPVWCINFGQIYSILKDLKRRGFLDSRYDPGDGHMGRWLYTVTSRGRRALETWLRRAPRPPQPVRDEFFIRLIALERRSIEPTLERINREEEACRNYLAAIASERDAVPVSTTDGAELRVLATEAAIVQAQAHLAWLAYCSRVVRERGTNPPADEELESEESDPPLTASARSGSRR